MSYDIWKLMVWSRPSLPLLNLQKGWAKGARNNFLMERLVIYNEKKVTSTKLAIAYMTLDVVNDYFAKFFWALPMSQDPHEDDPSVIPDDGLSEAEKEVRGAIMRQMGNVSNLPNNREHILTSDCIVGSSKVARLSLKQSNAELGEVEETNGVRSRFELLGTSGRGGAASPVVPYGETAVWQRQQQCLLEVQRDMDCKGRHWEGSSCHSHHICSRGICLLTSGGAGKVVLIGRKGFGGDKERKRWGL